MARIIIRVDGNQEIGTGHVMRCLSVAHALRERGAQVLFVSIDAAELLRAQGFDALEITGRYDDLSGEDVSFVCRQWAADLMLVDSYFADGDYFERHEETTTALFFDYGTVPKGADIIINYNVYADAFEYPDGVTLLGTQYAPLRAEFAQMTVQRDYQRMRRILISTGGTDNLDLTRGILRELRGMRDVCFDVVVGRLNCYACEIEQMADEQICVQHDVREMHRLMMQADMAISAAGTTLYELCCCGLPTVTFSFTDNQIMAAQTMQQKGLMLCAGKFEDGDLFERIRVLTERLQKEPTLRKQLGDTARAAVDGKGAGRLADALILQCGITDGN